MAGEGGERLYWMHFEAEDDDAHMVPAPVLVDSLRGIQRVVYLLAKFTRGEELGQRAAFSRELREAFALQCRVPEPGSYALPFEIGSATHAPRVTGEADKVRRLFRRVTAAVGGGDVDGVRALVPDSRYLNFLGDAYRKATPPLRSGVSYWLEDHRRRKILDSRRSEETLNDFAGYTGRKRWVREDTISGMLVGMDFDERRIRLTRPDGKSVSAYYDEESELPLIEHRRGWVELTGDVLYDAQGRALSVTHAREFVSFDEDTIELRNVHLYNVAYRASPPLRFKVKYDPSDRLYDLDGEFGISVSASSRSDLHHELQEALSMLWIEYGEESPDRLSPKARRLRTDLRKRLTAA
ncbi:MAG: hypothetical protein OXI57_00955 [Rhodospirillales bacterium]|nr:hypothetical protein [Rhodospirillales bacterium]